MTSFRTLARNHDFVVLWIGQTTSALGTSISTFAFPLVAYAVTRSAFATAVVEAAYMVGMLGMLLPAGALADRCDRRTLMRSSALVGALAYGALVAAGVAGVLDLPLLASAALAGGIAAGLFAPAETSAIRSVVSAEELPTALSQNQARQHVASLLGGPIGSVLYAVARWVPFAADAVSYAVSWILLGRIRTDLRHEPSAERRSSALADLRSGWRFLFGHQYYRVMLCWSSLTNLTVNAVFFLAVLRLIAGGTPPWQIAAIEVAAGVCGIAGSMCAPWIIDRVPTGVLMVVVAWSFVPLLVPMAFFGSPWVVMAALGAGIFLNPAGNAANGAYSQTQLPRELLGRFSGTQQFTSMLMMPLFPILAGALLGALSGEAATLTLAAICALVALLPTASRHVRSIGRPSTWRAPEQAEVVAPTMAA